MAKKYHGKRKGMKPMTMSEHMKAISSDKVHVVMHEFKMGKLKSGGKKVKSRKQAIAIALEEKRKKK